MKLLIQFILLLSIISCSKSSLEKINKWHEKEEYEKLLEFSTKNKSSLTEEEIYLSSLAVSKYQNILRKNKSDSKLSDIKYLTNLEKKIGLKIKLIAADNGNILVIDDVFLNHPNQTKYYRDKSLLDKFRFTVSTNETYENSFLLNDILEIDPRLFLQEFKYIWIESLKLGLLQTISEESKTKFIEILHYLANKDEAELKNYFFITEGKNINLRSGPGTENATVGKLNQDEVFQIDSDYNTTSIGNKTGKWIQVYVWRIDLVGWIFSPFLKPTRLDIEKAKRLEKTLTELTNFQTIDFNNWNSEEIPSGFYGNYIETKKEIFEGNVGFTIYPGELGNGICTKVKKDLKKIEIAFSEEDSESRIGIILLKPVTEIKSKNFVKVEIQNHRLYLNSKELKLDIEKSKVQKFAIGIQQIKELQREISLKLNSNPTEIFSSISLESEINSWELCIPQGRKASSHSLLFYINIY